MMVLFLLSFVAILAFSSAKPVDSNDEWVWVPTRSGLPMRVNLTEEMAQVEPFSFFPERDVTFELYTLKNPRRPQILSMRDVTSILRSNFNKNVPTRIHIHGFLEIGGAMKHMFNDAFFLKAKADVNLIAVNWERASQTVNYVAARSWVPVIGEYVATMIDFMIGSGLVSINDISLIGFSLGAHIAGIAGKHVISGKLPKIVGLDPAGPLFSYDNPLERLDRLDAKYVEIMHTSGAFLGMHPPIGTVEFYPNTGYKQIGCAWDPTGTCSHLRSYKYFAESIYSPVPFTAYPCASYEDMKRGRCGGVGMRMGGEPGNYKAEVSIYHLTTNSRSIFARGA